MWVGRGFDSDGDGDNDFFIGGSIDRATQELIGTVVGGSILVCGLLFLVAWICSAIGTAWNNGTYSRFAAWLWAWIVTICFWGFIAAVIAFAIAVLVIGVFYKEKR